jgi:chaperonin cofactor prefoldin
MNRIVKVIRWFKRRSTEHSQEQLPFKIDYLANRVTELRRQLIDCNKQLAKRNEQCDSLIDIMCAPNGLYDRNDQLNKRLERVIRFCHKLRRQLQKLEDERGDTL